MTAPTSPPPGQPWRCRAEVIANLAVSAGLLRLDLALADGRELDFAPGQFAMLNLAGREALVFSRPFSILAATNGVVSFLYRVVGRGTGALASLAPGQSMTVLGPLGRPFPVLENRPPALLLAGGVGLPPLEAWRHRFGQPGDLACFGARDGADVPWSLLDGHWQVSVDVDRDLPTSQSAFIGLVTELARARLAQETAARRVVLACGPTPLLRAAAALAAEREWRCWLSLEEHMGCGYGVCKGCVVPVHSTGEPGWRNATCCEDGPVFPAETIVWDRQRAPGGPAATG